MDPAYVANMLTLPNQILQFASFQRGEGPTSGSIPESLRVSMEFFIW